MNSKAVRTDRLYFLESAAARRRFCAGRLDGPPHPYSYPRSACAMSFAK